MDSRHGPRSNSLQVQALYLLAELKRAANVDIDLLRRVLRANGVEFIREGRTLLVPLSEIRRKVPMLWESLLAAEQLRSRAGTHAGSRPARRPRSGGGAPGAPGAPRDDGAQG